MSSRAKRRTEQVAFTSQYPGRLRTINSYDLQFDWGKFDPKTRKTDPMNEKQYWQLVTLQNNDLHFYNMLEEKYPNLASAYLEAAGIKTNSERPMTKDEQVRAIYESSALLFQTRQMRFAEIAKAQQEHRDEQDEERRQELRDEFGDSELDEDDSVAEAMDAAEQEEDADFEEANERWRREEYIENSDDVAELAADREEDEEENRRRVRARYEEVLTDVDDGEVLTDLDE